MIVIFCIIVVVLCIDARTEYQSMLASNVIFMYEQRLDWKGRIQELGW